jgi:hypothetical protein
VLAVRVVLALVVTAAAAGMASASTADRVVTSPGRVLGLARSGFNVAFLSGRYRGHCGPHVEFWDLATGGQYKLGRHTDRFCSEGPSTGSGITDLAVASDRVAWLAYTGGNLRDWILYTATPTRPTERQLEFREVDVDAAPPIVLGTGSEWVIPYATGSTVKVLSFNGHRVYSWRAPGQVTNMTAYGQQVAVFVRGGHCYVLSPRGAVLQTYMFPPGAVQEFALGGRGLVVQLPGGRIEVHNGPRLHVFSIPQQAKMLDYAENTLLYRIGNTLHGRVLWSGKDGILRHARLGVLEPNGLSYAVGNKVSSIAWVTVTTLITPPR